MRVAKAERQEIFDFMRFFQKLERMSEERWDEPEKIGKYAMSWLKNKGHGYYRILIGYDTLVNNCCDPDLDHLDFRKDIKDFLESQPATDQQP
jgi:hypothetical protein